MMMTISISQQAEAKLRQRAAASGREVSDYASELVEKAVTQPTLDELLEPVRADFAATGMSCDEIDQFGRDLIDSVRRDNRTGDNG